MYESNFKLADLGLSHFKETITSEEKDVDSYGTRAYGRAHFPFVIV